MQTAINNFQKRHKAKVTGVLTSSERSDLVDAADRHEREFGWSVVTDPATGIRIGLPTKLVPHAREGAHGTHWSSRHGDVQVETFRLKDPKLKLSELYERERKQSIDAPDRIQRLARRQLLPRRHAGLEVFCGARLSARR